MRHKEPHGVRRLTIGLSGLVSFLASGILAVGFDLNGSQYDGWVRTFSIFAVATIPATIAAVVFQPRLTPKRVVVATLGLVCASIAIAITVTQYGDSSTAPYQGSHRWPNALAWIGLVALLAVPAAMSIPGGSPDGDATQRDG